MSKRFLKSVGIFILVMSIQSCKKDVTNGNTNQEQKEVKQIDYSRISKTSSRSNSMLVFESWEHFYEVVQALATQCEVHTNAYIAPLAEAGLVDDDLSDQIALDGFNAFQPTLTFANTLNFESFYKVAEVAEKIYMDQDVEELDPAADPFRNVERYESALLNTDGDVRIGEQVFNLASESFGKNTSCKISDKNEKIVQYWYTSSLGSRFREMTAVIGPRPFQTIAHTTLKFKNRNGKWRHWFTNQSNSIGKTIGQDYTLNGTFEYGCNENQVRVEYKTSSLPWGFYIYCYSWHAKYPSWNIKYAKQVTSVHRAPGYTLNHAY